MGDQVDTGGLGGGFTLRINNFRTLKRLEWSPHGVCLLAGYNGAGKSTVLKSLSFLRGAYLRGVHNALSFVGGRDWVRHRTSASTDAVCVELEMGGVVWTLMLPIEENRVAHYHGEYIQQAGEVILHVPPHQRSYIYKEQERSRDTTRSELRVYETIEQPDWLESFVAFVRGIRCYDVWNLHELSTPRPEDKDDSYLHPTGRNLAHVLRNWRVAPRQFRHQFEWVRTSIKRAFPDLIEDMEYIDDRLVFYPPGSTSPDDFLPLHLAADGLLTGLLQLTAVAGARDRSLIAFDEVENQLHPHAIRSILSSMRELADERDLTILLTTHSPVVMNAFREEPEQFYVLEVGESRQPVSLLDLHDEDWLAQFSLGDLYDRLDFGAPPLKVGGD